MIYICIGFPRCGTTSLITYIKKNSNIEIIYGRNKSLEFDIYTIKTNYNNNKIYFGKNPSTIYDIYSIKLLKKIINKNKYKIIIQIRNPLEYLISIYKMRFKKYNIPFNKFLYINSKENLNITYLKTALFTKFVLQTINLFGKNNICIIFNNTFVLFFFISQHINIF